MDVQSALTSFMRLVSNYLGPLDLVPLGIFSHPKK
jgi:hypothetical protein